MNRLSLSRYVNYLINGNSPGKQFARTMRSPIVKIGFGFFILVLIAVFTNLWHEASGVLMATAPFVLKFDKSGLDKDNLAFVKDLEQRISAIGNDELKEVLSEEFRLAVRQAKEQLKLFEGLKSEDVAAMKEMLGTDDKGVRSILVKQGELITELQQKLNSVEQRKDIRSQVESWQKRNKAAIDRIKAGQKAALNDLTSFELETRTANSPMTPANTYNDTVTINPAQAIREGAPVFDLRRVSPTFWDYLPKGSTNREMFPWVNKKVPAESGEAAFIGPGVAKPGVSFTFEIENSQAKKVAVSMKLATELLDDVDGMTSYVQIELMYQLNIKINSVLMTGVLSSTSPAGVQTFSLAFTASGLETVNPNNWDCVRAIVAQMRASFINGPIVCFLHPFDVANMDMEKAQSQGQYMQARQVPGAIIVEDYNIPAGYVQAIALDALKTLIYKPFSMTFGWENDDFTKNLVTVVAETRFHSFHSDNDAAAFVYDALADIKASIASA